MPQGIDNSRNTFYFDDITISQNPKLAERFFYSQNSISPQNYPSYDYEITKYTPVRYRVNWKKVSPGSYYFTWQENYHPGWQLENYPAQNHYRSRGLRNGWLVNVEDYCARNELCKRYPDNTFDISFDIRFAPQRTYIFSTMVSGIVMICLIMHCVVYLYQKHTN